MWMAAVWLACAGWAGAALVDPDPHSLLKSKKILVLDGGSGSHPQAAAAGTANLKAMQTLLGLNITFSANWQTPIFAGYDLVVFNYFFETQKMTPAGQEFPGLARHRPQGVRGLSYVGRERGQRMELVPRQRDIDALQVAHQSGADGHHPREPGRQDPRASHHEGHRHGIHQ